MAQRKIVITIDEDGNTAVEGGTGFHGPSCEKIIMDFCKQLGSIHSTTKKPEYYKTTGVSNDVKTQG